MSTKSYTLADGTTATVTATENGVPFNEGMQALTKAIKARVAVRDGGSGTGGASGKLVPTLILSQYTFNDRNLTATITYTGDGSVSATDGSVSGNVYTSNTHGGSQSGLVYALETNNYTSAVVEVYYAGD